MKLEIDDFIFEIRDEILCYDELGEKKADEWERNFRKWLSNDGLRKKNIKKIKDKFYYVIEDESEIFDMADEFLQAVENNNEERYWKKFQ